MATNLLTLEPVPTLLKRVRGELAAEFQPGGPIRVSRAPGRLDVMGGIADYTGSLVCEMPLDRAAAVAVQGRDDRQVQVFSFNLLDEHKPFTLRIPVDSLRWDNLENLRREFAEPGRKWAAYLAGCLTVLDGIRQFSHTPQWRGMSIAVLSTVPVGAGVSSSAAIEVATMMSLYEGVERDRDAMDVAQMCQRVENEVVGAPCGLMDQATSAAGEAGKLFRMVCQPSNVLPPLRLPPGVRVIGINSGVKHSVGGGMYGRTRCAAFMGHKMILDRMRHIGAAMKRELHSDPMHGYLANLNPDDYKRLFRESLPEWMKGREFIDRFETTIDTATKVDPDVEYPLRHAVDHHVLEARRVHRFVEFLEQAAASTPERSRERGAALDRAGHLMYGSHVSYTNDAMLGAPECDLLVDLVRKHERAGLYGARITGGGSGGTVAVLCDEGEKADAAVDEILAEYEKQTGKKPEALTGTSPGAWQTGTAVV
jgi:L-arabinokinase